MEVFDRVLTAEKFVVLAQRQLRAMGGTQGDAEELAELTANEGWGAATQPLRDRTRLKVRQLFEAVVARQQVTA